MSAGSNLTAASDTVARRTCAASATPGVQCFSSSQVVSTLAAAFMAADPNPDVQPFASGTMSVVFTVIMVFPSTVSAAQV
jgi:hypothetical protein